MARTETQIQRTDLWPQQGKERLGRTERGACTSPHVKQRADRKLLHKTGSSPWFSGTTEGGGLGWEVEEGRFKREGTNVYLWLIHVVWQKPIQYCKAITLQLKINSDPKEQGHNRTY